MQANVRTTIRIRKDLLDQSKIIAIKYNTSLQEVINNTLALGFGKISDLETTKQSLAQIDQFKNSLSGKKVNLKKLLDLNKIDQK